MKKVLVTEKISDKGVALLKAQKDLTGGCGDGFNPGRTFEEDSRL
jgi:hypothetical protein